MKIKAITLWQPWAWAIFHGKPVENRSWPTNHVGALLIHAGKTFDHDGYRWLLAHRNLLTAEIPARDDFQMSAIIGGVWQSDCVSFYPSPFFFGPWGHVYTDPIEFTQPIPAKGHQGLWDWEWQQ